MYTKALTSRLDCFIPSHTTSKEYWYFILSNRLSKVNSLYVTYSYVPRITDVDTGAPWEQSNPCVASNRACSRSLGTDLIDTTMLVENGPDLLHGMFVMYMETFLFFAGNWIPAFSKESSTPKLQPR